LLRRSHGGEHGDPLFVFPPVSSIGVQSDLRVPVQTAVQFLLGILWSSAFCLVFLALLQSRETWILIGCVRGVQIHRPSLTVHHEQRIAKRLKLQLC
jgi:hypothetical protein